MIPTAEQVLSNLPFAITLWTAITLCWGVYVHNSYNKMMKLVGDHQQSATWNAMFITVANSILIAFLVFEYWVIDFADPIIVVNTFYTAYLIVASRTIAKWWATTPNDTP